LNILSLPLFLSIAPFAFIDLKADFLSRLFGCGHKLPDRFNPNPFACASYQIAASLISCFASG